MEAFAQAVQDKLTRLLGIDLEVVEKSVDYTKFTVMNSIETITISVMDELVYVSTYKDAGTFSCYAGMPLPDAMVLLNNFSYF